LMGTILNSYSTIPHLLNKYSADQTPKYLPILYPAQTPINPPTAESRTVEKEK
jgi:hypothetical protein